MKSVAVACLIAGLGSTVCASSASASIIVPGTADIWAWNGGPLPYDAKGTSTVLDILPVLAIADLSGIGAVTFSVTGMTANCTGCFQINGEGPLISHSVGAANGLPNLTAHLNSLVGAWIDPDNYGNNVAFEIGQGGTFIVPTGAKRLYLGSMDAHEWNNNLGWFSVDIRVRPIPGPLSLSLLGAGLIGAAALRRIRKA